MKKYILQIVIMGNMGDEITCLIVGSNLQRAQFLFNEKVEQFINESTEEFTEEEKQEYREDCYSVGGGFIDGLVSGDGDWAVYLLSAEDNESDPLQDFCNEEAPFRLEEIHNIPKDQITEDMIAEVSNIIRDCIDYNEDLYDSIDYDIREYLENNYKKEEK